MTPATTPNQKPLQVKKFLYTPTVTKPQTWNLENCRSEAAQVILLLTSQGSS